MGLIILDLDNTIADDEWRIPRINWQKSDPTERYHDYHMLSSFDAVGNRSLFEGSPHDIVIFTARPTTYASITYEWLQRNGVKCRDILMRNRDDHRPSVQLKATQLNWLLELYGVRRDEIVCAYDDRPDVVQMYWRAGIRAELAPIHTTCAYTPPTKEHA